MCWHFLVEVQNDLCSPISERLPSLFLHTTPGASVPLLRVFFQALEEKARLVQKNPSRFLPPTSLPE